MNKTPNSNRKHIGIFGKTNSGKSSLLNAITEQEISIVSDIKGTTTDSVTKAMELIPYGPVLFIDTGGLDDTGILGNKRVETALNELKRTDFILYVLDATDSDLNYYKEKIKELKRYKSSHLLVINKMDLLSEVETENIKTQLIKEMGLKLKNTSEEEFFKNDIVFVSSKKRENILIFKELLVEKLSSEEQEESIIGDLLEYGDTVVMVIPIDSEAPKGRLILPQVQLIRDCLDHGIKSHIIRESELESTLKDIKKIDLVITDSQVFKEVDIMLKDRAPLTSFSILFARQKGNIDILIEGAKSVEGLKDGAKILIAETCTHNTSHDDIGRVKIPKLLQAKTGKKFEFIFKMGREYPKNLEDYDLVIHCGGCMVNKKNMQSRISESGKKNTPITNYGLIIAHLNGILDKSIEILKK